MKDNWTVQASAANLTNVYGPTNISSALFIKAVVPLPPRILMFTVNYTF